MGAFLGTSNASHILKKETSAAANVNTVYANCLQRAFLGQGASIEGNAFRNCYSLTSITIPDGVTSIGTYAFSLNYSLGKIRFLPQTPPTVSGSNAFSSIETDCIISVPTGTLEAYTTATNYPSSATYTYVEE